MKPQKKHYWAVDQSGFISVYALIFLQITIAFVTMICIRCNTLILSSKENEFIEVFLIHHVKQTYEDGEPEDETLNWKDYEITIRYESFIADITYEHKNGNQVHIQIEYDDICMCVMKIAYLEEP